VDDASRRFVCGLHQWEGDERCPVCVQMDDPPPYRPPEARDDAIIQEPCNAAIGLADLDYVLRWLEQIDAPQNVIDLQKRGIRIFNAEAFQ